MDTPPNRNQRLKQIDFLLKQASEAVFLADHLREYPGQVECCLRQAKRHITEARGLMDGLV